jgi:hypothetical protein
VEHAARAQQDEAQDIGQVKSHSRWGRLNKKKFIKAAIHNFCSPNSRIAKMPTLAQPQVQNHSAIACYLLPSVCMSKQWPLQPTKANSREDCDPAVKKEYVN